eukprot:jgi/Ulvmu1/5940/UM026_0062.1
MYRVMSLPPGPDGYYGRGNDSGPYELVFQVPRLEAYVQECAHYTVVLPQYVAEEMREGEARKDMETREHVGDARASARRSMVVRQAHMYLSYLPEDVLSHNIATYIKRQLIDEYGATGIMLDPDDGKLNYVDFDAKMKVRRPCI